MRIAVIGGGTMGVGIAHRFARADADVTVVDVDEATALAAVGRVTDTLEQAAERGKLTHEGFERAAANVGAAPSIDALPEGLDLIVEAVIEAVPVKHEVLRKAEAREPGVLASNTSAISIDELALAIERPDRFAGMHFFNPVWAIDVVEVIRGSATSSATIDRIRGFAADLGMEVALITDAAGFATSRLGVLVGIEAIRMVEEGVGSPQDIDTAMQLGYRHPMGPLMLGDLVGLDIRLRIAEHLASVYGSRFDPPDLLRRMVAEGHLGKKSGRGFYDWTSGSARPIEEL